MACAQRLTASKVIARLDQAVINLSINCAQRLTASKVIAHNQPQLLWLNPDACSTPYGIKGNSTSLRMLSMTLVKGAQRLTASKVIAQLKGDFHCIVVFMCSTPYGIKGNSTQVCLHCLDCWHSRAQRLTASKVIAHYLVLILQFVQ